MDLYKTLSSFHEMSMDDLFTQFNKELKTQKRHYRVKQEEQKNLLDQNPDLELLHNTLVTLDVFLEKLKKNVITNDIVIGSIDKGLYENHNIITAYRHINLVKNTGMTANPIIISFSCDEDGKNYYDIHTSIYKQHNRVHDMRREYSGVISGPDSVETLCIQLLDVYKKQILQQYEKSYLTHKSLKKR